MFFLVVLQSGDVLPHKLPQFINLPAERLLENPLCFARIAQSFGHQFSDVMRRLQKLLANFFELPGVIGKRSGRSLLQRFAELLRLKA